MSSYKWSTKMKAIAVPCTHCGLDELHVVVSEAGAWIDCHSCGARGPIKRSAMKAMANYKEIHRLVQQAKEINRVGNIINPAEA